MDKTNIEYVLPEEIEMRSFEIIAAELAERGITLPAEQDTDHQTGDPYQRRFRLCGDDDLFRKRSGDRQNLIKNGADIVTDTNMALAGDQQKGLWLLLAAKPIAMADGCGSNGEGTQDHPGSDQHGTGCKTGKAGDLRCGKCTYGMIQIYEMMQETGVRHSSSGSLGFVNVSRQGADHGDGGALYHQRGKRRQQ